MEINIEIDEITNCLVETTTGEECKTEYHQIGERRLLIETNEAKMLVDKYFKEALKL